MGIIGVLIGVFSGLFLAVFIDAEMVIKEDVYEIEVLNDNQSVSGSFFIGSGQIEGKMKYVFYSKDKNKFKLNQVDYDKAEIEYTSGTPVVIKYSKEYTNSFKNNFAIDLWESTYLFKIPSGSINNEFSLDAK